MTHFFLQENFNGLISQGPWVFDSAQHKKRQPDMGLRPSTAVIVKWKDQFPSALKIERATLPFKWPLCSKPFTYPNNGLKYRNFLKIQL